MAEIEPKTREEKLWNGEDIEPVTREEMYIKHIFDKTQTIPDHPITRKEMLMEKAGEGGGGDITIKQLIATENKTYSEEDTAYSPVIVNVPDVPPVLDELTVTENGTYTPPSGTDGYDEVTVSVPLPPNAYLLKEIEDVAIASFNDGADLPMPKLEVAIEPQQEGSGEPSPTNVRPIIGWTECNVEVSGVNIWDEEWEVGGLNPLNGETTSENNRIRSKNYRPCKPNMTMFYYIPSGKGNLQIVFYDINKNYLGYYNFTTEHTFTTPNGCCFFKFNTGGSYGTTYNNDISINYPSTDTSYHAYNGSTYTIDLDGTRYGGTLDVVSGVLTITHKIVDLGTQTWGKSSLEATIIYISMQDKKMGVNPILCSSYKYESDKGFGLNFGAISDSSNQTYIDYIFVRNQDFSGKTDLECKTAMNGVQAVYELATPQNYQLTPTQVKSLLGVNNVWADTGDILEAPYFAKEVSA